MVSYRSPKPMFGVRNPAGVQNKSYQYLTLLKKGVYLLEITITQKMQTLNTILLLTGAEGRDTTRSEMV